MLYLAITVLVVLGAGLGALALAIEVVPNLRFHRHAVRRRCRLRQSRLEEDHDDSGVHSLFTVELLEPAGDEPRSLEATYKAQCFGAQYYSEGRARQELARFEPGRAYDCWVYGDPPQAAMVRRAHWGFAVILGLIGLGCWVLATLLATGWVTASATGS